MCDKKKEMEGKRKKGREEERRRRENVSLTEEDLWL